MDGKSIVSAVRNGASAPRDGFLIEYYSDGEFPRVQGLGYQAIRTDRHKFIRYRQLKGADELYDLQADPHELNNLALDADSGPLLQELNTRLDELLRGSSASTDAH
jgi:N-acetylglucosamine-6-sulfatase